MTTDDVETVPQVILHEYTPSTPEEAEWKCKCLELWEKKRQDKNKAPKIGDTIDCVAKDDISWNNGKVIKAGEEFRVKVIDANPNGRRKTKQYRLVDSEGKLSRYTISSIILTKSRKED